MDFFTPVPYFIENYIIPQFDSKKSSIALQEAKILSPLWTTRNACCDIVVVVLGMVVGGSGLQGGCGGGGDSVHGGGSQKR